jgi:hypothetical protein
LLQRTLPVGQSNGIVQDIEQSAGFEPRDIFLPPRDIFGAVEERNLFTDSLAHDTLSQRPAILNLVQQSSSSIAYRDMFFPPRDIFGAADAQPLSTASDAHNPLSQRVSRAADAQPLSTASNTHNPLSQRVSRLHPNNNPVRISSKSGNPPEFYGVRKGFEIGVCDSWPELARRITGFPKPEFKTFAT